MAPKVSPLGLLRPRPLRRHRAGVLQRDRGLAGERLEDALHCPIAQLVCSGGRAQSEDAVAPMEATATPR